MTAPSSDHHLLAGFVALKLDLINRDQLVQAMDAWMADSSRPLVDILRDQGALSEVDRQLLEPALAGDSDAFAATAIHRAAAFPTPALTSETVASPGDLEPASTVSKAEARGQDTSIEPTMTFASPQAGEVSPRFQVLRPHARGGLGEVFVAKDLELNREVALKEIQSRFASDPGSRARFLVEAEITGGLEHPGIVPVYGLGRYADGRPYYAMRFIDGDSLQEAADRFHGKAVGLDPQPKPHSQPECPVKVHFHGLEFRTLLGRFVDVCQAIEYAHSRGVLHRDLKPGNIMLGKYGETLVVDWGLAKTESVRAAASDTVESILQPSSASGHEATLAGTALGTPAYMPPEQAAGRIDQLGPASDVYSLGATLYYLLTGAAPFTEKSVLEILQAVQAGTFPRPHDVQARVPRPLESICLKAMSRDPADRYTRPRDLVTDIERWLADEPVAAYRERHVERAGRWLRRNRAWTVSGVASLLLIALVSLCAVLIVNFYRIEERNAKDLAQEAVAEKQSALIAATEAEAATRAALNEKKQALVAETEAKDQARHAIDNYVDVVTNDELLKEERFKPLMDELLADALAYYQDIIAGERDNPERFATVANATRKVAEICETHGNREAALEAYRYYVTHFREYYGDSPSSARERHELGHCLDRIGVLSFYTGKPTEAWDSYEQALSTLESIVEEDADDAAFAHSLAQCCHNAAVWKVHHEEFDAGESLLGRAITLQKKCVDTRPSELNYQHSLSMHYSELGAAYQRAYALGRSESIDDAISMFEASLAVRKRIFEGHPDVPLFRSGFAFCNLNFAFCLDSANQPHKAKEHANIARAIIERLVEDYPTVTEYKWHLGLTNMQLARQEDRLEMGEHAFITREKAIGIFAELHQQYPTEVDYAEQLAKELGTHADKQAERGDVKNAISSFERAKVVADQIVQNHSDVPRFRRKLADICNDLGACQHANEDYQEALSSFDTAAAIRRELVRDNLAYDNDLVYLARHYHNAGDVYRDIKDTSKAREAYVKALAVREEIVERVTNNAVLYREHALCHEQMADLVTGDGHTENAIEHLEEAAKYYRECIDLAERQSAAGQAHPSTLEAVSKSRSSWAVVSLRLKTLKASKKSNND